MVNAASALGAEALTGPFFVAGIALALLVQEGQSVVAQQKLPSQLQAHLTTVKRHVLQTLVNSKSSGGSFLVEQVFLGQIHLGSPLVGVPSSGSGTGGGVIVTTPGSGSGGGGSTVVATFPSDGTAVTVSLVRTTGRGPYVQEQPTVQISSWPVGPTQASLGVPDETIGFSRGVVWNTPSADQKLDGLKGWLPSGEIHYFNWAGAPELAIRAGNGFLTMPSPGSTDMQGFDAGPLTCTTANVCIYTNNLEALGIGGQIQGAYNTDTITGVNEQVLHHFSNGRIDNPNTLEHLRIGIHPNPGTPAGFTVINQYGQQATATGAPPSGGLRAGQTVKLADWASNALGYSTTYTWEIETKCPINPTSLIITTKGVRNCTGVLTTKSATGLSTCVKTTGGTCTQWKENSAFHTDPVTILKGQNVSYTWPTPGTYHVRLITKDQYGVTRQQDTTFTIVGTTPMTAFSSTAGFSGGGVVGPVHNGDPVSITGCINSPDMRYALPTVTVNWGDGTTNTQSGSSLGTISEDSGLSVVFKPATNAPATNALAHKCASSWAFTAAHTYTLPPGGSPIGQKPLTITVSDGYGPVRDAEGWGEHQLHSQARHHLVGIGHLQRRDHRELHGDHQRHPDADPHRHERVAAVRPRVREPRQRHRHHHGRPVDHRRRGRTPSRSRRPTGSHRRPSRHSSSPSTAPHR